MNTTQEQLLLLLKLAIHGGVPAYESFSSINGEELFNLALQQNVSSFLYPTLNKHREYIILDEQFMHLWNETTLIMATRQISLIYGIRTILDLFNTNGIPAISLKGLVLKQLYPQPELRNMGDLDLFIDEINMQKSIELLATHGYHPNSYDLNNPEYMHIEMRKLGSISVELHRTLWHPTKMKKRNNQLWFDHIWANKRLLEIEGFQYTALSPEDELINLVVHLARHLMYSRENLQQLCDIVLFINTYRHMLDLEYLDQTLISMDLFDFYQYLLLTCHLFFGLLIPDNLRNLDKNKSEMLMNDILSSKMLLQITDESKYRRSLPDHTVRKIKTILHGNPIYERSIKFLKGFNTRAHLLRSIGLHLKY